MIVWRFWRVGLLVLALLWSQAMGLWHGTLHPFAGHTTITTITTISHVSPLEITKIPPIFGLLSAHEEGVDCQLFDQLGHGDALTPLLQIAFVLTPALAILRASHADFLRRWHTQCQARAPPLSC